MFAFAQLFPQQILHVPKLAVLQLKVSAKQPQNFLVFVKVHLSSFTIILKISY
jgi:hypothetical protein